MASDTQNKINVLSIAMLVLGILSILIEEWFGFIFGLAGIILFVMNRSAVQQYQMPGKGIAIIGLICSIVGH